MLVFFNTNKPVVPFFEKILPLLNSEGIQARAFISSRSYRESCHKEDNSFINVANNFKIFNKFKIFTMIKYMFDAFIFILIKKPNYCIFMTQPPMFYSLISILCRSMGIRYSIHIMDMYPDVLFEYNYISERSLVGKLLNSLSLKAYNKSDKIIVLGSCMQERLVKKGVSDKKIKVIRNWAHNEGKVVLKEDNFFINDNNLMDKKIILYAGNMGVAHYFKTIMAVAQKLNSVRKDIVFVFVGSGVRKKYIRNFVEDKKLTNVKFFPYQGENVLDHLLSAASVHYFSLAQKFTGTMIPSKFYGMLASSKPIIFEGSNDCEISNVLKEYSCGNAVIQDSVPDLMDRVLDLCEENEVTEQMGFNAGLYYKSIANSEVQANLYLKLIKGWVHS